MRLGLQRQSGVQRCLCAAPGAPLQLQSQVRVGHILPKARQQRLEWIWSIATLTCSNKQLLLMAILSPELKLKTLQDCSFTHSRPSISNTSVASCWTNAAWLAQALRPYGLSPDESSRLQHFLTVYMAQTPGFATSCMLSCSRCSLALCMSANTAQVLLTICRLSTTEQKVPMVARTCTPGCTTALACNHIAG